MPQIAIAPSDEGQLVLGIDLQESDVGLFVAPDDLGIVPAVILENYSDLLGLTSHMVVGDDVTGRVDDEARTERNGLPAFLRHAAVLEEPLQKFIKRCRFIARRAGR